MARTNPLILLALVGKFLIMGGPAQAGLPVFSLPIACTPGSDCFVQNYVDDEQGPQVRDYACGSQSYDGHKGTDIRIRSTRDVEAGVAVLAAAAGTVIGTRDGMPDRLARDEADRKAVAGRECGNGVLIDHGDGWQTQYCHMRQGSLAVADGQKVERGARLGEVGYSGEAAFPHLHFAVRHLTEVIDPFTGKGAGEADCNQTEGALWAPDAAKTLVYRAGEVMQVGFLAQAPTMTAIEEGRAGDALPEAGWPALVAWGWAINLEAGDEVVVTLSGPAGELARNRQIIDRKKAQMMLFAGLRRPAGGWAPGGYVARFQVQRGGQVALTGERPAEIR